MHQKAQHPRWSYKFAKVFMLIGGIIMCILALLAFIDGATVVGIMTLIVGGIFFLFSKGLKVPPPPVPIATLKEEAIKYMHAAKELGEFPMTGQR